MKFRSLKQAPLVPGEQPAHSRAPEVGVVSAGQGGQACWASPGQAACRFDRQPSSMHVSH